MNSIKAINLYTKLYSLNVFYAKIKYFYEYKITDKY